MLATIIYIMMVNKHIVKVDNFYISRIFNFAANCT